ncbi:MAG: alpha-isopropylmalate synthase regulatory domain-containing protein, partial [bacterium]|nr:alpha-isopropylmalate synthase regulatory domain-containing protein [bacterium]
VANSLAAVKNGARQVECTINGIGERAGNASLEEIVMALKVRAEKLKLRTSIISEQLVPSSRLLSTITGIGVQPNKAIVGINAFAHESGIHQDGLLKSELTYSIMTPSLVGLKEHRYVLGKHSGRHALKAKLEQMGQILDEESFQKVFVRFKDLADRKKQIYDEDLEVLLAGSLRPKNEKFVLENISVKTGLKKKPQAEVVLRIDGKKKSCTETGDGPLDAAFKAIKKLTKFKGELVKFSLNSVTEGRDAQGEAVVVISDGDRRSRGTDSNTDVIVASALAYVNALNRLESSRSKRLNPQQSGI